MYFWKFFKDQQPLYISKILTTTKKMLLGVWFNFCPGKRKLMAMFTFCFLQNQIKTKIWQLISSLVSQFSVQNLSFLLIWKKNLNFANSSRFLHKNWTKGQGASSQSVSYRKRLKKKLVLQRADVNGFLWGILQWAIRLGVIRNHHLCIAFGTKTSRFQKGQSIKYTSLVQIYFNIFKKTWNKNLNTARISSNYNSSFE